MGRPKPVVVLWIVLALLAASCSNSSKESTDTDTTQPSDDTAPDDTGTDGGGDTGDDTNVPVDAPGVTDDTIRIGGVASVTNPLGGSYGEAFEGVKAYFAMINDEGGIYGRQLELVSERDDQVSKNPDQVQALISEDDVFAVLPVASLVFNGASKLTDEGMPTFGWNINPQFAGPPNLFGDKGSYLCFTCPAPVLAWIAQEESREKVAVLAYGVSAQSTECAEGWETTFEAYPTAEVVFVDKSLPFGVTDLSVTVDEMKKEGVDLVLTCMDNQGVITLAKEMDKQQLDAVQYLPNGYDFALIEEFGDLFEGSFVGMEFWPFEVEDPPAALEDYFHWIEEVGAERNELSMAGWLNADLFVTGLREAGPEFSREKVIDGLNQLTDWDAGGIAAGVDWTIAHEKDGEESCTAVMRIEDSAFVPAFGEPGKPFLCFEIGAEELVDPERRA